MTTRIHDIVEHSIEAFAAEVVARTLDGWAISSSNPGDSVGLGQTYTVSMYRNAESVETARKKLEGMEQQPRKSRAEILADARAAKASKARLDTQTIR